MGAMRVDKGGGRPATTPPLQQSSPVVQQNTKAAPAATQATAFKKEVAKATVKELSTGKSIEAIALAQRVKPEAVIQQLKEAGYGVTITFPNSDVRKTEIRDLEPGKPETGQTVTEYYDFQHDSSYSEVKAPGNGPTFSPVRDGLGYKVTTSRDQQTGAVTTRYEDDLGSGTVIERTRRADGSLVEVTTAKDGQQRAVFTTANGRETILAGEESAQQKTADEVSLSVFRDGKTVAQVAHERGLRKADVLAILKTAGVQVEQRAPTDANGHVETVTLLDPATNGIVIERRDHRDEDFRRQAIAGSPASVAPVTPGPGTGAALPGGVGYLQQRADNQWRVVGGYDSQIDDLDATIAQTEKVGKPVEGLEKQRDELVTQRDLAKDEAAVLQAKAESAYMARLQYEADQLAITAYKNQAAAKPGSAAHGEATTQLNEVLVIVESVGRALVATDANVEYLEVQQALRLKEIAASKANAELMTQFEAYKRRWRWSGLDEEIIARSERQGVRPPGPRYRTRAEEDAAAWRDFERTMQLPAGDVPESQRTHRAWARNKTAQDELLQANINFNHANIAKAATDIDVQRGEIAKLKQAKDVWVQQHPQQYPGSSPVQNDLDAAENAVVDLSILGLEANAEVGHDRYILSLPIEQRYSEEKRRDADTAYHRDHDQSLRELGQQRGILEWSVLTDKNTAAQNWKDRWEQANPALKAQLDALSGTTGLSVRAAEYRAEERRKIYATPQGQSLLPALKDLDDTKAALLGSSEKGENQMREDRDHIDKGIENHSLLRKAWNALGDVAGGLSAADGFAGAAGGETFGDSWRGQFGDAADNAKGFVEGKIAESEKLQKDLETGRISAREFSSGYASLLGTYNPGLVHHAKKVKDSDETWNTIDEAGRMVSTFAVALATRNVAWTMAMYEAWDGVGDVTDLIRGRDMYADGHSSFIGLGGKALMGKATWGDTWNTVKDETIDFASSGVTVVGFDAAMLTSAKLTAKFGSTLSLGQRVQVGTRSALVGQAVDGGGRVAIETMRLATEGKLGTKEGDAALRQTVVDTAAGILMAPLTGGVSGALPNRGVAAVSAEIANDAVANFSLAEVSALLNNGRHMNTGEAIGAAMETLPGMLTNRSGHPNQFEQTIPPQNAAATEHPLGAGATYSLAARQANAVNSKGDLDAYDAEIDNTRTRMSTVGPRRRILVIGKRDSGERPPEGTVFINTDPAALPDILTDIRAAGFANESFDEVIFEYPLRTPLRDPASMRESFRVLKPGGILRIKTGELQILGADERISISQNLTEAGFRGMTIALAGYQGTPEGHWTFDAIKPRNELPLSMDADDRKDLVASPQSKRLVDSEGDAAEPPFTVRTNPHREEMLEIAYQERQRDRLQRGDSAVRRTYDQWIPEGVTSAHRRSFIQDNDTFNQSYMSRYDGDPNNFDGFVTHVETRRTSYAFLRQRSREYFDAFTQMLAVHEMLHAYQNWRFTRAVAAFKLDGADEISNLAEGITEYLAFKAVGPEEYRNRPFGMREFVEHLDTRGDSGGTNALAYLNEALAVEQIANVVGVQTLALAFFQGDRRSTSQLIRTARDMFGFDNPGIAVEFGARTGGASQPPLSLIPSMPKHNIEAILQRPDFVTLLKQSGDQAAHDIAEAIIRRFDELQPAMPVRDDNLYKQLAEFVLRDPNLIADRLTALKEGTRYIAGVGKFGPILRGADYGTKARLMEGLQGGEIPWFAKHRGSDSTAGGPEVGTIAISWGNVSVGVGGRAKEGFGLTRIAEYTPELVADLPKLISEAEVVRRFSGGNAVSLKITRKDPTSGDTQSYIVNVMRAPDFQGSEGNWTVTSVYRVGQRNVAQRVPIANLLTPVGAPPPLRARLQAPGNPHRDPPSTRSEDRLNLRTELQAKKVPSLDDYYEAFFGKDAQAPTQPQPIVVAPLKLIELMSPLFGIAHDGHAHPKGYDARLGPYYQSLAKMVGPYAEIAIGGIPVACGYPHYTHPGSRPLSYDGAAKLDERHIKDHQTIRKNYQRWAKLMANVAQRDPQLAHTLDLAALNRDKLAVRAALGKLSLLDSKLAKQVKRLAGKTPHLAVSAHLSVTGFNPADKGAARYLFDLYLKHYNIISLAGEATLQKENVTNLEMVIGEDFDFDNPDHIAAAMAWLMVQQVMDKPTLLHCDWGLARVGVDGALQRTDDHQYEIFDKLLELLAPFAQHSGCGIVLAHTGVGRYVKPDDTLVPNNWSDINGVNYGGSIPRHIEMMERAIARAPGIKFDVSWNDVGYEFTYNPRLREGLICFVRRHPDAITFGSDTLKPVNESQYFQNLTTLLPFIGELGVRDPQLAANILRKVFEKVVDRAPEQTLDRKTLDTMADRFDTLAADIVKERRQRSSSGNPIAEAFVSNGKPGYVAWGFENFARMLREADSQGPDHVDQLIREGQLAADGVTVITHGRQQTRAAAEQVFAAIDYPAVAKVLAELELDGMQPQPSMLSGELIVLPGTDGIIHKALHSKPGTPDDSDTIQGATPTGYRWKEQTRAKAWSVGDVVVVATGALAGALPIVGPVLASGLRVILLGRGGHIGERDRRRGDQIFEEGQITTPNLDVYLNRVLDVATEYGVPLERQAAFVHVMAQLRADAEAIYAATANWQGEGRKLAFHLIEMAAGLAQIKGDEALGRQALGLSPLSEKTRRGRLNNTAIASTAAASVTGAPVSAYFTIQQLALSGLAEVAAFGAGGAVTLLAGTAFAQMIRQKLMANRAGRGNINPELDARFSRLQQRILTGIEASYGLGAANEAMLIAIDDGNVWLRAGEIAINLGVAATADVTRRAEKHKNRDEGVKDPGPVNRRINSVLAALGVDAAASGVQSPASFDSWMKAVEEGLGKLGW